MTDASTPARWLEASVEVGEELAELVADVMARFAPGGVALGYRTIEPEADGEGRPAGLLLVRAYLPYGPDLEDRRNRLAEALWHLGQISPVPEPAFREIVEEDWSIEWKKHYRPLRVGRRLRILPSWIKEPADPGSLVIRLDPGMAFGTGMHPTTQLCLAALENLVTAGSSVIDLGCGSGILSIAALRLGARRVLGVDTDPAAVRIAAENVRRNGLGQGTEFRVGSLAELLAAGEQADVVAANILAVVLRRMLAEGLAGLLPKGGRLILSGILADQSADVEAAVTAAGMQLVEKREREDWVALVAARK